MKPTGPEEWPVACWQEETLHHNKNSYECTLTASILIIQHFPGEDEWQKDLLISTAQSRCFRMLPAKPCRHTFDGETVVHRAEREGVMEDQYRLSLRAVASSPEA